MYRNRWAPKRFTKKVSTLFIITRSAFLILTQIAILNFEFNEGFHYDDVFLISASCL